MWEIRKQCGRLPGGEPRIMRETVHGTEALTAFVRVDKAFTRRDGLKRTKNPQSVRTAAMGEPFSSVLRRSMPDGPVVSGPDGSLANPDLVGTRWTDCFKDGGALQGMRRIVMKNLRHTHATLVIASGVDPATTARAHCHSQEVEYNHYLNPTPRTWRGPRPPSRGGLPTYCA
ncbi:MAG: hypothetical protein LKE37_11495, partial [Atopobiaceae bacterium]|nr:hypothetical protein [Atopobiaceae bacterium]